MQSTSLERDGPLKDTKRNEALPPVAVRTSHVFDRWVDHYPLADRELTRAAREPRNFVLRAAAPLIVLGIVFTYWLDSFSSLIDPVDVALGVSLLCAFAQLGLAIVVAPLMSAGLIADEKQERTLPLLLMADMRGWDIFLAKFLSVFVPCSLLILSTAPLLGIVALLGGVELGAVLALLALSLTLTASSCAVSLWASVRARSAREGALITLVVLTCWHAGSLYIESEWLRDTRFSNLRVSGLIPYWEFVNSGYLPPGWLWTVLLLAVLTVAASLATIRALPRLVYREASRRSQRRKLPSGAMRWLRGSPLVQLVAATTSGFTLSFDSWPLRVVTAIGLAIIVAVSYGVGIIFIALLFCYDIASCMMSIRRSGALDDILTTPLDQQHVARAFLRVHLTRSLVYLPALVVTVVILAIVFQFDITIGHAITVLLVLIPSQVFLVIAAGSYAGTQTNRAASQAALTVLLIGLTIMLAAGVMETFRWYAPRGLARGALSSDWTIYGLIALSTLFNTISGMLCYAAFASQLREDLISTLPPRFRSFSEAFGGIQRRKQALFP